MSRKRRRERAMAGLIFRDGRLIEAKEYVSDSELEAAAKELERIILRGLKSEVFMMGQRR